MAEHSGDQGTKPGVTDQTLKEDPSTTIFGKILRGDIPCRKVYEDDGVLAFHDINPVAPVHVLVIPKKPVSGIAGVSHGDEALLGHLMVVASKVAAMLKLSTGYRLVINEGKHGQQSVRWLHVHIIGGRQLLWPPG